MIGIIRMTAIVWMPIVGAGACVLAAPVLGMGAVAVGALGGLVGLCIGGLETAHIVFQAGKFEGTRLDTAKILVNNTVNGVGPATRKVTNLSVAYVFNKAARETYRTHRKSLKEADRKLRRLEKIKGINDEETSQAREEYLSLYCHNDSRFSRVVAAQSAKQ